MAERTEEERSSPTSETDPLSEILDSIHSGIELNEFKCLIQSEGQSLGLFKDRLLMKEVPKGWSPLVTAVEQSRPDILKYMLNNFSVNIEQETPIPHYGKDFDANNGPKVTALWMAASTKGNSKLSWECLKLLVKKGADMNHMCNYPQATSPLAEAISKCQFRIARYLASNATNAGIQWHSTQDGTHLLIEALKRFRYIELLQTLVDKGANVNCAERNGNTPLHFARSPEAAKILIDAGAKNTLNDCGLSAVVYAAKKGRGDSLVDYLIEAFQCGPRELYDVYCIQAVVKTVKGYEEVAPELTAPYIQKAVEVRSSHPDLFSNLPPANEIYDGIQEPATMDEFKAISQNKTKMCYVCSIYCERILGRHYYDYIMCVVFDCIRVTLDNGNYAKCIEFCKRSLDFGLNPVSFEDRYRYHECILDIVKFVVKILENGYIPSIQPLFQYALKAVKKKKIHRGYLFCSIVRLVALWIKVADKYITDSTKQEREHTHIKEAVQELIEASGDNGSTIITDSILFVSQEMSGHDSDLSLGEAFALLLDCGCPIHCRAMDSYDGVEGDFPLHIAARTPTESPEVAMDCVRTLLEHGAHVDAVNFKNETAKDVLCRETRKPGDWMDKMRKVIQSFEPKPPTLQCLSARAIVKYNIEYREYLPIKMSEFVSWHSSEHTCL